MEKEYIERNTLIENLTKFAPEQYTELINQLVTKQPAEDVEKVKYAKWEISSDGYYPYCTNCKTEPENGVMSKYCPECGARMRGDDLSEKEIE